MGRRAKRPLKGDAVQAADDQFYAAHPEFVQNGRRIPLDANDPTQADLRKEWMDLYEANGGEVEGGTTPSDPPPTDPPADPSGDDPANPGGDDPANPPAPPTPTPDPGGSDPADPVVPCPLPQKGNLVVQVLDDAGNPVEGAVVNVEGLGGSFTDASGIADFGEVDPGTYNITAEKERTSSGPDDPAGTAMGSENVQAGATAHAILTLDPCAHDFEIDSPCKIIKVGGGRVQMSASDLPGFSGGSFAWTTTSSKIRLINPNSATVTVEGLATPSSSRDAETITVTRTENGCSPIEKTVQVTVAKVTFSASTIQRYGYDDFDTPANPLDDHVCIKRSDHTFLKVDIEGGALGTDFDFVCDDPSICTPVAPGAAASFDLRLNAGSQTKAETPLHAKVKCPAATSFTQIQVHVYKEKVVNVVVAKIYDSTEARTNLRFPTADYGGETNTINDKLKEGVVKFNIRNYDSGNARTDVRYDLDGNGVLSYDIGNRGGAELSAIQRAMTGTGTSTRVAVIRDMKSFYYLSAAAARGATTIRVTGRIFFTPGDTAPLGTGASQEDITVDSVSGSTITLRTPLRNRHSSGEPLEFPASGWGSNPILVTEGSSTFDVLKWTIPHEAGHTALGLKDVNDTTNFMHYSRARSDYRLRYCPRTKRYETGTENQWDTISR